MSRERYDEFLRIEREHAASRPEWELEPGEDKIFREKPTSEPLEKRRDEGDEIVSYRIENLHAESTVRDMVFGHDGAGRIYPGALLWAKSLRGEDALGAPFLPVRGVPMTVIVSEAVMKEGAPASYDFDGTHAAFQESLGTIIRSIESSEARLSEATSRIHDASAALLELGLSAEGWGAEIEASLRRERQTDASVLLVDFKQAYFTLSCDVRPGMTYFDEAMFEDEQFAETFLDHFRNNGEIAVVNRVTYGRRLIMSVMSSRSTEELEAAVEASYSGHGVDAEGRVNVEQRRILEQSRASLHIIGGRPPDEDLTGALIGPAKNMLKKAGLYLGKTAEMTASTSAAVMSFRADYAYDKEALVRFETAEFSKRIRLGSRKKDYSKVVHGTFKANAQDPDSHASILRGDNEIHSDDLTRVHVTCNLRLVRGATAVELTVTLTAKERNSDGSRGDTELKLEKTMEVFQEEDGRKIQGVTPPGRWYKVKMFQGQRHDFQPFPDCGILRSIRVAFDEPGRRDSDALKIECSYEFSVVIGEGEFVPTGGSE